MNTKSQIINLRGEVLIRLIKAFLKNNFEENVNKIPFDMRPKDSEVTYRCCVYKERAILRSRIIAGLGFSLEEDDETIPLNEYAQKALERRDHDDTVLTVIDTACKGCVPSRIYVTDLCQGCVARPCVESCNFGAIRIINGRSVIDNEKCKKCTKCMQVCPYSAITKTTVPCEKSCPVDAIKKNEKGVAEIDFNSCISCGACIANCPFGSVHEKSQIIDILKAIKSDKEVVAMIAPSIAGQLTVSLEKIAGGFIQAGFDTVMEVAEGADLTALHEAADFQERMSRGDGFMTTSCCAAYIDMTGKHTPEIKPFMSQTPTPMHFTAKLAREKYPDAITVFVGPCVAKRKEGLSDENVDFVMSFEEMGALFSALNIDIKQCEDFEFKTPASAQGRSFGITTGVSKAVSVASQNNSNIKPVIIDGLNAQAIRQLKTWAKAGKCPEGNLVEVMGCLGGCVGGACVINNPKNAAKKIDELAQKSETLNAVTKNNSSVH